VSEENYDIADLVMKYTDNVKTYFTCVLIPSASLLPT